MAFDLRVESRFKNATLYRALDEFLGPGWTQHQAAEYCGVSDTDLGKILNLKWEPRRRFGEGYLSSFRKVADKLGYEPSELFPDTLYSLQLPGVVVREYESPCVLSLQEAQKAGLLPPAPDTLHAVEEDESRALVDSALDTLSPREAKIMRLRFGLNGEGEHSLQEIADLIGRSRDRIRQIEAKALRKLRHPSSSHRLRGLLHRAEGEKQ